MVQDQDLGTPQTHAKDLGLILKGALGSKNSFTLGGSLWLQERMDGRRARLESSQEQSRGPRREASQDPRPAPRRGKAPRGLWLAEEAPCARFPQKPREETEQKTGTSSDKTAESW